MLGGNLRKGQDTSQSVLLDAQNQVGHSTHNFPFKLFGSDFKIEPSIVDVSAEEARQSILLGNGLHGLVPVGFAFFHHGMECNRTEGFGNHPGMTHRIGRVLVAGGPGCGIIDPFESRLGWTLGLRD
jgi:hypothetical protein